jgi:hypothetical protein
MTQPNHSLESRLKILENSFFDEANFLTQFNFCGSEIRVLSEIRRKFFSLKTCLNICMIYGGRERPTPKFPVKVLMVKGVKGDKSEMHQT